MLEKIIRLAMFVAILPFLLAVAVISVVGDDEGAE